MRLGRKYTPSAAITQCKMELSRQRAHSYNVEFMLLRELQGQAKNPLQIVDPSTKNSAQQLKFDVQIKINKSCFFEFFRQGVVAEYQASFVSCQLLPRRTCHRFNIRGWKSTRFTVQFPALISRCSF